jgi:hypothetical protein
MSEQEQILRNINSRKRAEFIVSLAEEMVTEEGPDVVPERYWEVIATLAAKKIGRQLQEKAWAQPPMTMAEAVEFEKEVVPFGVHSGKRVREVPLDYWVAITKSKFNDKLVRYMRSDHFQHRVNEGDFVDDDLIYEEDS